MNDDLVHINRKHPDFQQLFDLLCKLAAYKNPDRWFNLKRRIPNLEDIDLMPYKERIKAQSLYEKLEAERLKVIEDTTEQIRILLDTLRTPKVFQDFISAELLENLEETFEILENEDHVYPKDDTQSEE